MTAPWTPTGDKWPQMAMVWVRSIGQGWYSAAVGDNGAGFQVPAMMLHAMPPTITPEQEAVIAAAERQERATTQNEGKWSSYVATNEAVRAMRAAQQPPDPVKELLNAAKEVVREIGTTDRLRAAIAALEAKS